MSYGNVFFSFPLRDLSGEYERKALFEGDLREESFLRRVASRLRKGEQFLDKKKQKY